MPNKISTDTRSISLGDIYIALKGDKFDGHDFICEALVKGAAKVYSALSVEELKVKGLNISDSEASKIHYVDNTLKTYQELASDYRRKIDPLVIAVTGSNGKTTTKEMLAAVLAGHFKIHYSEANFNNEIGVPKTILSMPENTEILILEMGMRGLGQIDLLSKIAKPNICIITCIGTAHIEILGSRDNIRKAKMEIINYIEDFRPKPESASTLILKNIGSNFLARTLVIDEDLYQTLEQKDFINPNTNERIHVKNILCFNSLANFKLNVIANAGIDADANAVFKVAELLGLNKDQVQAALLSYKALDGRGTMYLDTRGNLFINDTYNASPESLLLSIKGVVNKFQGLKILLVIGEILENKEDLIEAAINEISDLALINTDLEILDLRNISMEMKKELFLRKTMTENPNDQSESTLIKATERLRSIDYLELEEILKNLRENNSAPQKIFRVVYLKGSRGAKLESLFLDDAH